MIRDVVTQAKEVELMSQAEDPQFERLILRGTLHRRRHKHWTFFGGFLCVYFFCKGILPSFVMRFPLINEKRKNFSSHSVFLFYMPLRL